MKELDKAFNPSSIESKWYAFWEDQGYYQCGIDDNIQENFSILLPPTFKHMKYDWSGALRKRLRLTWTEHDRTKSDTWENASTRFRVYI